MKVFRSKLAWPLALSFVLGAFGLTTSASAKLPGEYQRFEGCPYSDVEARRCFYASIEAGEVVLGSRTVAIVNPVVLQGAIGFQRKETTDSALVEAKEGEALLEASQPVPGGISGFVAPTGAPPLFTTLAAMFAENQLTRIDATVEMARRASEVMVDESAVGEALGVALRIPIKIRLENPLLGTSCEIGSRRLPIWWELTTGRTSPPAPNKPIQGNPGQLMLLEEGSVLSLEDTILVDNSWSAPGAGGCGGGLSFWVNRLVNSIVGLPSAAGRNTAILKGNIYMGSPPVIKEKAEGGS